MEYDSFNFSDNTALSSLGLVSIAALSAFGLAGAVGVSLFGQDPMQSFIQSVITIESGLLAQAGIAPTLENLAIAQQYIGAAAASDGVINELDVLSAVNQVFLFQQLGLTVASLVAAFAPVGTQLVSSSGSVSTQLQEPVNVELAEFAVDTPSDFTF